MASKLNNKWLEDQLHSQTKLLTLLSQSEWNRLLLQNTHYFYKHSALFKSF